MIIFSVQKAHELSSYLDRSTPVVILHRSEGSERLLQDVSSSNSTSSVASKVPISEFEISQYQVSYVN
jgi:hypothetical protein